MNSKVVIYIALTLVLIINVGATKSKGMQGEAVTKITIKRDGEEQNKKVVCKPKEKIRYQVTVEANPDDLRLLSLVASTAKFTSGKRGRIVYGDKNITVDKNKNKEKVLNYTVEIEAPEKEGKYVLYVSGSLLDRTDAQSKTTTIQVRSLDLHLEVVE